MSERKVYVCPVCGGTKFLQTVKEEYDKIYDSEEHIIERACGISVGSIWTCTYCKASISLKLLHNLFMGVEYKGFVLLDIAAKIKELDEIRRTMIGE